MTTNKVENNQRDKIVSINPATLEPIGAVHLSTSAECREAIQAAAKAFPIWGEMPLREKQRIFRQAKQILLRRRFEIAELLTREKGSPFPESLYVEVWASIEVLDYYSHSLPKALRPKRMSHHVPLFLHKKSAYHYQPLGPTLVISPWNFPFLLAFYDVLSALTAGNTVVLRPSTSTPLVTMKIGEILSEAGLPPGVLEVLACQVHQAEEMISHPEIRTIMFTGSTGTGKRIMELASRNLTNIVLELGGKDPMIVLKDADIERAARGAVWAGCMNCGQSCGAVERIYVSKAIEEEFTERVVKFTQELEVGDPMEDSVDIGPMVTLGQLELVQEHIEDAAAKGAQILCGGKRRGDLPGYFIQPAVIAKADHTMKVMTEETFGPVLPIMSFSDPEEAISLANDCLFGLTSSVWTKDKKTALWMADRLESGTVTINDHMTSFVEPGAIWGGIKQSGIGRSHGPYGLLDLVNIKFISYDNFKKSRLLWWYPYDQRFTRIIENSLVYFHHGRIKEKIKALFLLVPHLGRILAAFPVGNLLKSFLRIFRK